MGASELFSSWFMTRMAFFHTSTSRRRSSGVSRSTTWSVWRCVFRSKPRTDAR